MANEPLKAALVSANLEPADLAAKVGVDARTVQRWSGLFDQFASHLDAIAQHTSDPITMNPDAVDPDPVVPEPDRQDPKLA